MKSSQQKDIIQLEGAIVFEVVIQQCMMHSIKSRGGLTRGRGITNKVRLIWIHSMNAGADAHNSVMEFTNLQHKTSSIQNSIEEPHIELEKNRIKRDNVDFKKIELFFEVYNLFDLEEPDLTNLCTGLIAKIDDQINYDQTEDIGKIINEKLDGISFSNSSKRTN